MDREEVDNRIDSIVDDIEEGGGEPDDFEELIEDIKESDLDIPGLTTKINKLKLSLMNGDEVMAAGLLFEIDELLFDE
jgi:hypothetical protein